MRVGWIPEAISAAYCACEVDDRNLILVRLTMSCENKLRQNFIQLECSVPGGTLDTKIHLDKEENQEPKIQRKAELLLASST